MHISQSKICMMHMFTYYPRFRKCSTLNKITKENIRITMYMYNNGNSVESFWCQLFSYNKNNIIFFRMVARDFIMNFWGKKMLIYKNIYSPRNENLNLLVRIKFLNLFLYSSKYKLKNLLVRTKFYWSLGRRTSAHREDCI